jgi:hypothetical protein
MQSFAAWMRGVGMDWPTCWSSVDAKCYSSPSRLHCKTLGDQSCADFIVVNADGAACQGCSPSEVDDSHLLRGELTAALGTKTQFQMEPELSIDLDELAERKKVEQEQFRLQLVKFVRHAADGVPCTYFSEHGKQRMPAIYCLDRYAHHLVIMCGESLELVEVVCPLKSILDIFTLRGLGAEHFPATVLHILLPGDAATLLMVVYKCEDTGKVIRFCFCLHAAETRDAFIENVNALAAYGRFRAESHSFGGGAVSRASLGGA